MNVEFLPEGDISADIIDQSFASSDAVPSAHSKKAVSIVIALSCIILCAAGILLHAAAAKELFDSVKGRTKQLLVSTVLPGATASPTQSDSVPGRHDSDSREKDSSSSDVPTAEYVSADLSTDAEGAVDISNETSYTPDINALSVGARPIAVQSETEDSPLVLIYHTHGTEAYAESASSSFRSSDISKNVVAVGTTIAEVLEEAGIHSIHLEEMFDSENWSAAYDTSTVAVREALKKYPSIKYIFDVHRDCIGNDEVGYIRSAAEYEGMETAQLMFVCGTDQGGSGHTTWQSNLAFALQLQKKLWYKSKNLMRPVDLRCASFYQDTGNGALLAEFGTCANTLNEAKKGAVLFASALADYILGEDQELDCKELIEKLCQ